MRPTLPFLAAGLSLALCGTALAQTQDQSDQLLNQATFAESEDATQVREEKAVEHKDQAGDPKTPGTAPGTTQAPAAPAPGIGTTPPK